MFFRKSLKFKLSIYERSSVLIMQDAIKNIGFFVQPTSILREFFSTDVTRDQTSTLSPGPPGKNRIIPASGTADNAS